MEDESYLILRRIFFWLLSLSFVILVPIFIFYSLGYKFDARSKKLLRTGTISIKSSPEGANIFLSNIRLNSTTPDVLSGLKPQDYIIKLEKEGFYSYQLPVKLRPSSVAEFNITLIPQIKYLEKLEFGFNIYKFFISKHFYGNKIIAFTDKGVYYFDDDFRNDKKISSKELDKDVVGYIEGLMEGDDRLVFWSKNKIWSLETTQNQDKSENDIVNIYTANETIKDVFFSLKERYLLIHDGLKIIALDVKNPAVYYTILELKDSTSKIFYDSNSDTLYIRDKIANANDFSLYKLNLKRIIHERRKD